MEDLPGWVDLKLSRILPTLRNKGEGSHLEFKSKFPDQGHSLAKEIAAFATSGGGRVLLGVSDDGQLCRTIDASTPGARDSLIKRIQGITRAAVQPAITPIVTFGLEGQYVVLSIEVPRGKQPVYYAGGRPCIRHLSESRSATPDEVIEAVLRWRGVDLSDDPDVESDGDEFWLSSLRETLVEMRVAIDEFEDRSLNPWLEEASCSARGWASELRDIAHGDLHEAHEATAALMSFPRIGGHLGSVGYWSRSTDGTAQEAHVYS